jgi:FkbM family methyltransferase
MIKRFINFLFSIFGFQVKRVDKSTANEIGKWEWIGKFPINTIIDVGANQGQFAEKILKVFPKGALYCFEPLPDVFSQLRVNFGNRKNVHLYNFGLGEKDEEVVIFNNEYSPSSSLLEMLDLHKKNFDFAVKTSPRSISIKRLDDFADEFSQRPILIKIDVQGYEMQVIKGGEEVIGEADIIIIETTFQRLYKDQPLFNDIYEYFTKRGFYYAGNIEQLLSPVDKKILQADAIFIKSAK